MKKILIIIICFLILTNIGLIFLVLKCAKQQPETSSLSYKWLNPQLKFTEEPAINKAAYEGFRTDLINNFEQLKAEGKVSDIAVFFRDLVDGPTFGIDADGKFVPASLLKIPLALTYFKLAEVNPTIFDQTLTASSFTLDLVQKFPPAETIEEGKAYRVEDLLYRLIVYSDNHALEILSDYLSQISPDRDLLLETYKETGIIDAYSENADEETLSVKAYASIYRLLFNASYLSEELSEKMLDDLSKTTFKNGLRAGVPESIPVAHKFGEYFKEDSYELHDCGIVYYPQNPYLLCVMTKGKDIDTLSETIMNVSKTVYDEVNSRRLK